MDYPPIGDLHWPGEIADMRDGFAGQLNVYRTMAYNPRLLRAWERLRQHVVLENALAKEFSEVVILRTGHVLGSEYEWTHHVSRARACGMDDDRIMSIRGSINEMNFGDAILAQAVDELLKLKSISVETRAKVVNLVGVEALLDLIATVGFYVTLASIIGTFSTPIDPGVAVEMKMRPLEKN